MKTIRVPSRASYTKHWGYSRALALGPRILVSGTSATLPDGSVHAPGDPYQQACYILDVIDEALREVNSSLQDVVLTRVYLTDPALWRDVGRAHLERFGETLPVSTCIAGAQLMQPDLVVEIEAEAMLLDA